jgi:hypothetical protein
MSAQLSKPDRPNFASGDWFPGTAEDYQQETTSCIAYSGPFHVDEANQTLTDSMFVSLFPDCTGQTQARVHPVPQAIPRRRHPHHVLHRRPLRLSEPKPVHHHETGPPRPYRHFGPRTRRRRHPRQRDRPRSGSTATASTASYKDGRTAAAGAWMTSPPTLSASRRSNASSTRTTSPPWRYFSPPTTPSRSPGRPSPWTATPQPPSEQANHSRTRTRAQRS